MSTSKPHSVLPPAAGNTRSIRRAAPLLALVAGLAAGCGEGEGAAAAAPEVALSTRSSDPLLVAAREAIEAGDLSLARELVAQLSSAPDPLEVMLLEARVAALAGDPLEAGRWIERAREQAPSDSRVYATAAELHAAHGRLETASAELERGVAACGVTTALQRAQGVALICAQGRAREGLRALEGALEKDPGLPFVARPLGQAHLLVGKHCMGDGDAGLALEHAERSLEFDPLDVDARRFLAECSIVAGDLGRAVRIYDELIAEGEPLETELASLCKNAGIAALVQRDRTRAVDFFARARELGLPDRELATGVDVLRDAARTLLEEARALDAQGDREGARAMAERAATTDVTFLEARVELAGFAVESGLAALEAGQPEQAVEHLRTALAHDPDSLEAHHFLGSTLFSLEDWEGAADQWTWVVTTASYEDLELPEPVHLFLAQALERAERTDEARGVLEEYLRGAPEGRFVEETRSALDGLGR